MAEIIPFPLIEGALCIMPSHSHSTRKEPASGCFCEHCIDRRRELVLAEQLERELRVARDERDNELRRTSRLERDAG